jgi:phosphoglucomutase
MEKIAAAMSALRADPITELAGAEVEYMEDYQTRRRARTSGGGAEPLALPSSNMIRLLLWGGAWVVVRPSGTEPKLKLYIGANAQSEEEVDALLCRLLQATDDRLSPLLA